MKLSPLPIVVLAILGIQSVRAQEPGWAELQQQFVTMPMEARRLTGPLFWMHGDETPAQLERELTNVFEGHNGTFTTEPRPHKDWLGEGWYRDLGLCLDFARRKDLTLIIYDDWWWPSQMMGGRVPAQYGSKVLVASATEITGPKTVAENFSTTRNLVAVVAGRSVGNDMVDGSSLVDLTSQIKDGSLSWEAPEGSWRLMTFTWKFKGKEGGQQQYISVDGADPACVDWFIKTVYQPHYDRFKNDFGKTIRGYFYDEPETQGDWGSDVPKLVAERKLDLAKLLVAYKFKLAGEEQAAAYYSYLDCFAESWGRTMFGGLSRWCREHKVFSMGHFMEHVGDFFSRNLCAGNMMQLQKFSDMGGIDVVCDQVQVGARNPGMYQMPKIASSISHTYNKSNDVAFCEIFGGYGQKLTYPEMKWLTDWEQVRGVNFMIPHSFNPRAPNDTDYPPYFNNGGFEPRWPLYRIWADYNSRLSLMLTGGRHVAPVAFLHLGQSFHVGEKIRPEEMTTALQDAQFDCDWLLYDAWEKDATLENNRIRLHKEDYRILVVPAAEVIPYPTLVKAREFFEKGGVVIGYGLLPSKSATLGHTSAEITQVREAIWGTAQPGLACSKTNSAGGRAYFLPAKPTPEDLQKVLVQDAKVHPTLEIVSGDSRNWLHVLHRQKSGRDVFLVCNQDPTGPARSYTFSIAANGEPECWDPMRDEINAPVFRRVDAGTVQVDLTLEPSESVLLVFWPERRALPARLDGVSLAAAKAFPITRVPWRSAEKPFSSPPPTEKGTASPVTADPFDGQVDLPGNLNVSQSRIYLEVDELAPEAAASVTVNNHPAGGFIGKPLRLEVTSRVRRGANDIRIEPFAPKTARLIVVPR